MSVYDKTDIVSFAKKVSKAGYTIISSGGTAKELKKAGLVVVPIQDITGNPESFDGRMKTISFQIESGILFDRSNPNHVKEAKDLNIPHIDMVVCNFYPFDTKASIEHIDVGGPTMVRAAAKNHESVYVVLDPKDYGRVASDIAHKKKDSSLRKELAAKAFAYLSWYDSHIAQYLSSESFPEYLPLGGKKVGDLRYGDNPHQQAAWYLRPHTNSPLAHLKNLSGRELSVTNLTDINAGIESVRMFSAPAAVVIKHNTPCGLAVGSTTDEALARAIEADPVSAFGGVIVLNKKIDVKTAEIIGQFKKDKQSHLDIIAAPDVQEDAQKILTEVRKTTGIYTFGEIPAKRSTNNQIRWIDGGYALQTLDNDVDTSTKDWKVVTKKKPTKTQMKQIETAWKFIARVKSNAILIVDKDIPMTRGIGTGQTSRIGAAHIALTQADIYAKGAVLASDAFFPFSDTVELAARYGIQYIIQPGGSIRDKDSIYLADEAGMVMVFTGKRAFWH